MVGRTTQAMANSRTVRPLEILARKPPTKGENANHHHEKIITANPIPTDIVGCNFKAIGEKHNPGKVINKVSHGLEEDLNNKHGAAGNKSKSH